MQYSSLGLGLHLSSIGAQRARKRSEFCHIADCEPAVSSSGRGRQAPSPRATVRQSLGAGVDRGLTGLGVVEETGLPRHARETGKPPERPSCRSEWRRPLVCRGHAKPGISRRAPRRSGLGQSRMRAPHAEVRELELRLPFRGEPTPAMTARQRPNAESHWRRGAVSCFARLSHHDMTTPPVPPTEGALQPNWPSNVPNRAAFLVTLSLNPIDVTNEFSWSLRALDHEIETGRRDECAFG